MTASGNFLVTQHRHIVEQAFLTCTFACTVRTMAALLFPTIVDSETMELVIMPKDSVRRSEEERRLLGAHWVERKTIWEDCREVDGADFTLTVYLSYDESGRVKKLEPNLHLPALVVKVLVEASWSACNEPDEVN
jgi:hypothetical protein